MTSRAAHDPFAGANGFKNSTKFNSKSATFSPGFTVNVNTSSRGSGRGGGSAAPAHRGGGELLPPPEFASPAQVRNYCNAVRAAGVTLAIEVAMGAEILKGVLAAVPDPEGRLGASRIRAFKVARKLQRSADALRDAAKNAAATYSAFQQEYEEEINRVRHRARRPQVPRMDWAQQ